MKNSTGEILKYVAAICSNFDDRTCFQICPDFQRPNTNAGKSVNAGLLLLVAGFYSLLDSLEFATILSD